MLLIIFNQLGEVLNQLILGEGLLLRVHLWVILGCWFAIRWYWFLVGVSTSRAGKEVLLLRNASINSWTRVVFVDKARLIRGNPVDALLIVLKVRLIATLGYLQALYEFLITCSGTLSVPNAFNRMLNKYYFPIHTLIFNKSLMFLGDIWGEFPIWILWVEGSKCELG